MNNKMGNSLPVREDPSTAPGDQAAAGRAKEADSSSEVGEELETTNFYGGWWQERLPKPPVLGHGEGAYGRTEYQAEELGGGGGGVTFKVVLNCTGSDAESSAMAARVKTLAVREGMPLRVRDLKSCVEREYSIPACCQRLLFERVLLEEDSDLLSFHHIRDGDTIHVCYTSKADVAEILSVVDHMTRSYHLIESIQDDLAQCRADDDLDALISQGVYWERVNDLPEVYFTPCSSDRAEANRNLFIQCGGLDMLQRLHALLHRQPWANTPLRMQYLEHSILRTYWNITAAFTVRLYVLQYPQALGCILKSFLRVELRESELMSVPRTLYAARSASMNELNRIACEVIYKALGALCK